MFVKSIRKAKNAIFPIFVLEQVSPTGLNIKVGGTGFFINSKGYFVSVAHIFDNASPQQSLRYWGRLPEEVINPHLEIHEVVRDDEKDIFVGRVATSPRYLYLSSKLPEIGKSVCISGYPLATIRSNETGGIELGGVRRYFQPSFVLDKSKASVRGAGGVVRTHDGFLVRDFGLFGMSGGPILDKNGVVVGVQASVTDPRISKGPPGRSISVENALAIRSDLILDLLKRNRIRTNLFGRF